MNFIEKCDMTMADIVICIIHMHGSAYKVIGTYRKMVLFDFL